MSDESDDKTEAPTPHRLEKAREEGQIPRSRELTSLLILLVGVCVIWFGGVSLARRLSGMLSAGLHFDHSIINDPNLILGQIILLIREAMLALLPLISGVVLVALISPVMLGGLVFSGKSLQPKFSKLNPLPGIKRMFSAQTGAELLKAILKSILVGSVTGFYLWHHWPQMLRLMAESPITAMGNAMDLVGLCALLVVLGVIPMVGFDVFFQIFSHLKKLRMSRQDIRDEFKQSEGDPHVKGRIRQMQRAAARRRMMADVPKADVIVNNPTHYSVALQYDENKMSAPKVVAKGAGLVALRIREIAAETNVPTLEAPPLARALYRHAEIGQQIPGQLYAAVAEVLAWVWQLKRWRLAGGQRPVQPTHLPVPEALDFINENPSVMLLSAAVLGLLGLVPGMPNLVFLLFTAGLLGLAWWMRGREQKAPAEPKPVKMAENNAVVEATWNDVQLEDSLGMEVGYRLIPMVDFQQEGELLGRIRSIRKKFAQEMGFLPPVVHIRDNMDLQPARYRILMKGVEIGSGDAYPGRWLAINPGTAAGTLPGEATVDPAFGLNAIWIESALKEQAQIQGYTVVEASTVVATHLNHLISQHAAELFGRQEAQQLLDRVAQEMPKLTEDLVPGVVTLTTLHKVLQNLLDEKVPIRDMRTILETLAEHAPVQSDPHELTAVVRVALGRAITQQWFPGKDEVHVIGLDTPLERLLLQALQGGGGLEPGLADRLLAQTQEALSRQEMLGAPPVLLVNHALRPLLSRFLRRSLPQLVVLSNLELSDNRHIRMTATIGGK
ncbi:flagellar type III secretion system protein FlhB [Escherichia coli]|nr:flagellar type III secretion system protein FlhB [Escherichia coli]